MIGFAAFVMRRGWWLSRCGTTRSWLNVRLGLGHDASAVLGPVFDIYLVARHLISIGTAKQGLAIELSYRARLKNEEAAGDLVKALNRSTACRVCRWSAWIRPGRVVD